MELISTSLAGIDLIEPRVYPDERGYFLVSWSAADFASVGLDVAFRQDNHSRSHRGVLRGLHYQSPVAQGKLVRVVSGSVFDVAVDLRRSSPGFGKWVGMELSAANHRMLWIPAGFAHGFLALEDNTHLLYKCTADYSPAHEHCIRWDDPDLAIAWPLDGLTPLVSGKDAHAPPFRDAITFT